jgi:hypothetical protein
MIRVSKTETGLRPNCTACRSRNLAVYFPIATYVSAVEELFRPEPHVARIYQLAAE